MSVYFLKLIPHGFQGMNTLDLNAMLEISEAETQY